MKTAYECIIFQWSGNLEFKLKSIKELIELSKEFPWLLNPRIKFKEFDMSTDGEALILSAKKIGQNNEEDVEILFDDLWELRDKSEDEMIEWLTEGYDLQSGWMTFEDRI